MKTTISVIIAILVLATGTMVLAHHQTAGGVTIMHTWADLPGYDETTNLTHEGNMTPAEAKSLLENATEGSAVILDVRTAWERRGEVCPMQLAVGMQIDPFNVGVPIWNSPTKNNSIPVHLQGPVGIAFNAQAEDGTDLIGWPFRTAGYVIMNPDFDNYLAALNAEGIMKKDTAIIVMCQSGWRSKYMADYLSKLGYSKVYSMGEGLSAWNQAGYPVSTTEADWIAWDRAKLYDPARLAPYGGAKWPNSVFLTGGDVVIPEWFGQYVPPTSMVGYPHPGCNAPAQPDGMGGLNNVGLNGPWPIDNNVTIRGIVPKQTSIAPTPAGWTGPTLNSMCIQTMMGFKGMDYPTAVGACAGVPAVVPGYFDAWPIKKGFFIDGGSLPIRGVNADPCGDMFTTDLFGPVWYPPQSNCEQRIILDKTRDCNPGDPLCVGTRTYCSVIPPSASPPLGSPVPQFGTYFYEVTVPVDQFWTPGLIFSVDFQFTFSADILADVNVTPTTLNTKSKGEYVTATIKLPAGYDNTIIDISTVKLLGTLSPVSGSSTGDSATVKFNRAAVGGIVSPGSNIMVVEGSTFGGVPFVGSSIMNVQ
jgi:rhodanese-related sulfurtransferase